MQRDQQAGQHRGQGQFHHHQPVQRRGRQNDDRAQTHLDETHADNGQPGQHQPIPRSAKAVTIMPET